MTFITRARLLFLLLFFSSMLNSMEQSQLPDHFSSTLSKGIIQHFMLQHLPDFQDKGNFGRTSTKNFAIMQNLPNYADMADKAIHKKRKLLLLQRLKKVWPSDFEGLLNPCISSITHDKENKRDFWRNTRRNMYHVAWNDTSTTCILSELRLNSPTIQDHLYVQKVDGTKISLRLSSINVVFSSPFIPENLLPSEAYFNENGTISWYRTLSNHNILKLITINPCIGPEQLMTTVDCYLDGGALFKRVSLCCLKHYSLLVNKITQLQPCHIKEDQYTYSLSDLRVKGKELPAIEKSIIKSIAENSVNLQTLDTKNLLMQTFFCYKYGNMPVLSDYFKEYENRSIQPSDLNNQWMGTLWEFRPDEVHKAFEQCTFENTQPLQQFLDKQLKSK